MSIYSLPEETLLNICSRLPTPDLLRLQCTCKLFNRITRDNALWKERVKKYFAGPLSLVAEITSYQNFFKEQFYIERSIIKSRWHLSPIVQIPSSKFATAAFQNPTLFCAIKTYGVGCWTLGQTAWAFLPLPPTVIQHIVGENAQHFFNQLACSSTRIFGSMFASNLIVIWDSMTLTIKTSVIVPTTGMITQLQRSKACLFALTDDNMIHHIEQDQLLTSYTMNVSIKNFCALDMYEFSIQSDSPFITVHEDASILETLHTSNTPPAIIAHCYTNDTFFTHRAGSIECAKESDATYLRRINLVQSQPTPADLYPFIEMRGWELEGRTLLGLKDGALRFVDKESQRVISTLRHHQGPVELLGIHDTKLWVLQYQQEHILFGCLKTTIPISLNVTASDPMEEDMDEDQEMIPTPMSVATNDRN